MPRQKTLTSGLLRIRLLEHDFAADGGNADAVAVPGNTGHDSLDDAAVRAPDGPSIGPNRSEFISAMGRAPMVKMSRMMPPTPVAAPW